ncbi:MAG TPA: hypothetical protein VFJ78_06035 [Gaiellaceae bacterium]|nr:hypothetical protein [Gaiellaceae bacterium]
MHKVLRPRREFILGLLFAVVGVAATLAVAANHRHPFRAHLNRVAVTRPAHAEMVEGTIETFRAAEERAMKQTAPFQTASPGAYANAMAQRGKKPKAGGSWSPIGNTPLHADSPEYAGIDPVLTAGPSRLGWRSLSGRITAFTYDPSNPSRIFAAPATGGIWETANGGGTWRSVGDRIPSQAMGGVAFSPAAGGTLIVGTGDNAVGGIFTPSGLGVYASRNDGGTWTKASGVPDGLTTYKVVVDPTNPNVSYVATSKGLFRSTDDGVTYANVNLPTGACAGDTSDSATCALANVVSDVAVQAGSGSVIAVVGWAYGQAKTKAGIVMAPQNGIYTSASGQPGTFTFQDPGASAPTKNGFAPTPVVGRTTLAVANGPGQNHDVVYALVQDATKLSSCLDPTLDIPVCTGTGDETLVQATYLDGMYESSDFGRTWTKVMSPEQLRLPGTGSALEFGILGYGPGIQSWYNNWIAVDPTSTDALTKLPNRIVFGLEEIWENALPVPVTAPAQWKVIGRYWNACVQVIAGVNCAGGNPVPGTTTHPDQHAGLFVPDGVGGVTLFAGNDGGAYRQHLQAGQDFSNDNWTDVNAGLNTLQPYDAAIAKDGTVVAGLQDNGEMKIAPDGREDMIFGGDGFYTAIDPNNSQRIVEEYANGAVSGSTDGGKTWANINPGLRSPQFATPLQLDPSNADHLLLAGREVEETPYPYTMHCVGDPDIPPALCPAFDNWTTVFDLGTWQPGSLTTSYNRSATAADLVNGRAYVAFCGPCSARSYAKFGNGLATNVGGAAPGSWLSGDGWHFAAANGLPRRYVTWVEIDPSDPTGKTVYATLGGYSSHWIPPGAVGEDTTGIGTGHVFVSHDAGETFTDISGDLPDAPADAVLPVSGKLVVGTDVGAFVSTDGGATWNVLGDLPAMPVVRLSIDPSNANRVVAATYGRGVWAYTFGQ